MTPRSILGVLTALVGAMACWSCPALAQPSPTGAPAAPPTAPTSPQDAPAGAKGGDPQGEAPAASVPTGQSGAAVPPPAQVSRGEVTIRVEAFGVGDTVREGDWAGLRLALTDSSDKPRDVAVQLHLPDSDGDTALYTRVVTLSPGREVGVWLYAPMPWELRQGSVLRVSVSSATPSADGAAVGQQIAWAPIAARRVAPGQDSLAAAVGLGALGLEQYGATFRERPDNPGAHELTQCVVGLQPQAFPDQWMGWGAFETIVWSEGLPEEMVGEGPARALREWVNRGGHLVIVLPAVGQTWTAPSNPLSDLMPAVQVERLVDVDLTSYRALLAGGDLARAMPTKAVVHRLVIPSDVDARDATPLITGPHGCVAARRLVGAGMVTLVGIDLGSRGLARGQAIRADAFWARILGKRAATMSVAEMDLYALTAKGSWSRPGGPPVWADERVGALIAKGREASVGVLMGLIVFITYWAAAGPIGFWVLKRRGLERHAWVAFVATAGVFTAAAWAGASALRPRTAQAWHYTVLDHIYGQPVQRARTFVSVLLPEYGTQRVSLGQAGTDLSWSSALVPWSDPASDSRLSFPDARPYLADVRALTSLDVPARSTIKTFRGEWLGGPRWSMPGPKDEASRPRLDLAGRLGGVLVHDLPGSLRDTRVILVRGQISESAGTVRRDAFALRPMIGDAFAWSIPLPWDPGTPLDLSGLVASDKSSAASLMRDLVPRMRALDAGGSPPGVVQDTALDEIIALYSMLEQPDPGRWSSMMEQGPAVLRRRSLHTMDLGRWFTQPCLIVLGHVDGAAPPVPLAVDGAALDAVSRPAEGRTVVRWVYPLAPRAHRFGGGAPGDAGAGQGDTTRGSGN